MKDVTRDPCPQNIVNDVGIGFCMGSIGGALWHGFKGYRNSPRGERFRGMITTVKIRAPVLGGNFAVWSGMFNAGDCVISGIRGKEDPWNAIMAGATTGGLLAARSGPRAMLASAIVGGIILGVMEGVGVMMNRAGADSYKPQAPQLPSEIQIPAKNKSSEPDFAKDEAFVEEKAAPASYGGLFSGLWGSSSQQ